MDPMDAIRVTFFQECEEGLADLEQGLLTIEGGDADSETVNAVFRAVHSIKGGAGAFGLEDLVRFSHVFETCLDEVRTGKLACEPVVVRALLRAADVLTDLVRAARDGGVVDHARSAVIAAELKALNAPVGAEIADDHIDPLAAEDPDDGMGEIVFTPMLAAFPEVDAAVPAQAAPEAPPSVAVAAGERWRVRFKPQAALYAKANEAALLIRELGRLGPAEVELDDSALPLLTAIDPEAAYLAWTVTLTTESSEQAIREVFEFVEDDCEVTVTASAAAVASAAPAATAAVAALAAPAAPAAPPPAVAADTVDVQALIRMAQAPAAAPAPASPPQLDVQALIQRAQSGAAAVAPPEPAPATPAAAIAAVAPAAVPHPPAAGAGGAAAAAAAAPTAGATATIRVDLDRVDRLIDLVGELVINQAVLAQRAGDAGLNRASDVTSSLAELEQLTREIQDSVMAIRAQPVKSVFQRMPRLAREVAAMTGKEVRLVTEGEGTEVDKTVIERLADPLTHMIRNAIDHGLETPDQRRAAGKPREGVVRLAAFHRSGRIVIEVSDDGRGINRERVRGIAVDKGLIGADDQLTDEELDNLIFMAGFSTAETVSDISGRGVGMDVVKRSIAALGGRISIASRPGKGSTFTLSLPLTLAVLDGMVVTVGDQTLVAPLTAVIETLQPAACDVKTLGANTRLVSIRGEFTPLIDVAQALDYRREPLDPTAGVALLIEGEGGARAALLVDGIQGQRQVVIKSLEANYRQVEGIAAATILGDGRVALILDIDALVANSRTTELAPSPRLVAAG